RGRQGSAQVLRLVIQERPADGGRARLRSHARGRREADPGRVEEREGPGRQGDLLTSPLGAARVHISRGRDFPPPGFLPVEKAMPAILDNARLATHHIDTASQEHPSLPAMLKNNALMDALVRNLTPFFAFFVFSLLAAILVSLVIGSAPSLSKF